METQSAIALINQLRYKPGWIFEAKDNTKRFENSICVEVTYPATDSSREGSFTNYPTPIPPNGARASFCLVLDSIDDETLWYFIGQIIMEIEEHEMREFLRVMPTGWAPFHPHQSDGMKRWAEKAGIPERIQITKDLHFGLA